MAEHQGTKSFFDVFVISVRDVKQKEATVGLLSRNKDLLLQHCRIHVYEDPPGPRKEAGGATFYILEKLHTCYKEKLFDMKILLLHSGGLSTRLPSQLGVGKLFMPMPVAGKTPVLLLNLKLKSLSQVVDVLSPGILITACDDLETFSIEKHDLQLLPEYPSGFVALGHLSPPSIGEGHGVYVLNKGNADPWSSPLSAYSCLEVLQKPSYDCMRSQGAILKKGEQEYVCTDSVYWFDHTVTRALLPLCPAMKTLTTELQIYGDFLECLGTREDKLYLKSLFDPVRDAELGISLKRALANTIQHFPLTILLIRDSKFHHFGTITEYVMALCNEDELRNNFNFKQQVNVSWIEDAQQVNAPWTEDCSSLDGTIMHSCISRQSCTHVQSVVEFCQIPFPIKLSAFSVLSQVEVPISGAEIPEGVLLHTFAVSAGFVTVACHRKDNMKLEVPYEERHSLTFLNKSIAYAEQILSLKAKLFSVDNACSLWKACLFWVHPSSRKESFLVTYSMIKRIICGAEAYPEFSLPTANNFTSFSNIVSDINISEMINFREKFIQ